MSDRSKLDLSLWGLRISAEGALAIVATLLIVFGLMILYRL